MRGEIGAKATGNTGTHWDGYIRRTPRGVKISSQLMRLYASGETLAATEAINSVRSVAK